MRACLWRSEVGGRCVLSSCLPYVQILTFYICYYLFVCRWVGMGVCIYEGAQKTWCACEA